MSLSKRHPSRPRPWHVDVGRSLGAVVVTVQGDLTAANSSALADNLRDLIDGQGNMFLVVDLRSAVVADVRGLDVLVAARRSLEDRGGRFLLSGPRPEDMPTLDAAGLVDIIEVHPSVAITRPSPAAPASRRPSTLRARPGPEAVAG